MSERDRFALHPLRLLAIPPTVAARFAVASAVAVAVAFALLLIYRVPSARQTRRANTRRPARRMRDVFRWHMGEPDK
ncbi:hypothetical protein, partial [Xanthomonas graminis]|uniref:hypothetical protein n=2 Tax=Xanthomonas graminis TaxID=3390026 RepID=UPI001E326B0B